MVGCSGIKQKLMLNEYQSNIFARMDNARKVYFKINYTYMEMKVGGTFYTIYK